MTKLESLCREFVRLTAGRVDVSAHSKLALAIAASNFTAAWPRVRNVANSIGSAEDAGFSQEEQGKLGQLLNEIEQEWSKQQ